ncbi:MAG: T9SS type A sorting domain-containing protein [Bacteroidetes bacterium]|nr:T9SS type A sorting domain-containing protein [Bacteroidota bacterium]MBU1718050.1 T9SS type A sorting domain-containing protein [Bacteroidota bacterium]
MKTKMKITTIAGLALAIMFLVQPGKSNAQEKKDVKYHVRIEKDVDGKKEIIDTTFTDADGKENIYIHGNCDKLFDSEEFAKKFEDAMSKIDTAIIKVKMKEVSEKLKDAAEKMKDIDFDMDFSFDPQVFTMPGGDSMRMMIKSINGKSGNCSGNLIVINNDTILKAFTPGDCMEWLSDDADEAGSVWIDLTGNKLSISNEKKIIIMATVNGDGDDVRIEMISDVDKKVSEPRKKMEVNDLKVFPNPTTDGRVTVQFSQPGLKSVRFRVYDLSGRTIMQKKVNGTDGNFDTVIDLSKESRGHYFLEIGNKNEVLLKKILFTNQQ